MKKKITVISLLIFITLASLGLKIAYINTTEIISPIRADAAQYVQYGYNLYIYGVYSQEQSKTPTPDSFRSPGFPLLISLGFRLGGVDNFYLFTLLLQATITSLLVPLSYLLAIYVNGSSWIVFGFHPNTSVCPSIVVRFVERQSSGVL